MKVKRIDLLHLLKAFDAVEAELEQLESNELWFSSDSLDRVISSKQILHSVLGIEENYKEDHDEIKCATPELRFE